MTGLLDGMRVLDFSVWRPMPHGTQLLADLGAEVLKVEPPGGDPMRSYPELFAAIARGKRSIVLDLRSEVGRTRARELAAETDVVCESWRPGVADRLGVGYRTVAANNPPVIYCSLTGYGQTGPWRDAPGHDVNFQALAGALRRRPDVVPTIPLLPAADLEGGTMAALLISAAWARRIASGVGEHIDVAMADVMALWVGAHGGVAHRDAVDRTRVAPGYGVFETRDGEWIALGVLAEQRLWEAICAALGLTDLAATDYTARLAAPESVNEQVATAIVALDLEDALARLRREGAPVSPVLTPELASSHEQLVTRRTFLETANGLVPDLPAQLEHHPRRSAVDIPEPDAHSDGFTRRAG